MAFRYGFGTRGRRPVARGAQRAGWGLRERCGLFGGVDDLAQGVSLSGGVVAVRLGLVAEPAAHADDGDGGVGQAGEVAGQAPGAHARAVLVVGDIANVVPAVLDLPVPAVEGEDFGGAGAGGRERGEAVDGLDAGAPGLQDGAPAQDAERLPAPRQAAMSASTSSRGMTAQVRSSSRPWALSRVRRAGAASKAKRWMSSRSVGWLRLTDMTSSPPSATIRRAVFGQLCRASRVIVRPATPSSRSSRRTPTISPPALSEAVWAVHHAAAVFHGGHQQARRVAAARTVQRPRLAIERERPAGAPPGRRPAPHGAVQGVRVEFRQDAVDGRL